MSLLRVQVGSVVCEVDVDATRSAYATIPATPMGGCKCEDCRNFAAQAHRWLTGPCFEAMEEWGIDRLKPNEVSCVGDKPGARAYWVTYGVAGRVLRGPGVVDNGVGELRSADLLEFLGHQVNLDNGDPLVARRYFPVEAFGFEVNFADVPWVLDEQR